MSVRAAVEEPRAMTVGRVRELTPAIIVGWLGAVSAYVYGVQVVQPFWPLAAELHRQIIEGTAASPYRDRLLMPFIAEALSRLMPLQSAYLLLYFALFPIAYVSLFCLLRRWYPVAVALLGTVIIAAVMPLALRDHYFQPGTWLELVLVITALHLLARPNLDLRLYTFLAAAAALNRETGMVLGLLLVVVAWPTARARRLHVLGAAIVPIAIYGAIRVVRGVGVSAEHDLLARNLPDLPTAVVQVTLFGAVLGFLAIVAWRDAPALLRRAALIVPPYLALVAAFGIWRETRLLVPLLPIAIGIGLGALTSLDEPRGSVHTRSSA